MATNFILTLDTTAPVGVVAELAGGAANTGVVDVNLHTTTTDADFTGYQMKVWGDVDGAPDEASAAWVAYVVDRNVTLTTVDGLKTVYVKVRDDVGNESAPVSDTITLDTVAPTINITVDPSRTKISKVDGWSLTTFSFASDQDLQAWSVRAVPSANSAHDEGTEIPTTVGSLSTSGGALAANVNQAVTIHGADLETATPGDGDKIIKIFGQDTSGIWSA